MSTVTVPDCLPTPRPDHRSTRRPSSKLGVFLWRRRMWFESTFVLSMLEPWEKFLMLTIFTVLFILVVTGLFKYLPHHLVIMRGRAMYYLWGQEGDERILWQWLGLASGDMGKDLYTGGLLGEL
ncbi:uncharacterized protein LACBIDRAFT_315191 [Laccaria bicolor S238N-H82]|uniref:Predicted protein n=1 Tax=Laccaria bicolor (strain S238N-H82 / ATCC MYA-4686) TaxID=486041 RepID=B0E016_LACBS|nr:uncharacterized protein LACBIDRAFT_315191 [Laccaria bicolor S238N-H82]EDQ99856.1 predicted protein [Laccaria bicolor S238N-H82]|eukprot:XP_001889548.1 predicted protein [Laccaria bicolor S238N-H82]